MREASNKQFQFVFKNVLDCEITYSRCRHAAFTSKADPHRNPQHKWSDCQCSGFEKLRNNIFKMSARCLHFEGGPPPQSAAQVVILNTTGMAQGQCSGFDVRPLSSCNILQPRRSIVYSRHFNFSVTRGNESSPVVRGVFRVEHISGCGEPLQTRRGFLSPAVLW